MALKVEHADVLVKVEVRTPHKTVIVAVGEEFGDKVVVELQAVIQRGKDKAIKVTYEGDSSEYESYTWIDCPQEAFIYRTYTQIAVDGPPEQ